MGRVILHCDLNNFYASCECSRDMSIKDKPVAVCGSQEERHGIVLAKNYHSKAFGVSTGEAIWQAKQKCPKLVIVPPHYELYDLRHTFATMALEHGMDVKTLSAMIGHVSSATTLDIYSHITTEMEIKAAQKIDKGIGRANTTVDEDNVPTPEKRERSTFTPKGQAFKPYEGKIRKSGTGGIYQINDHLWEGSFYPRLPNGKRKKFNVYAETREQCEAKLAEMIAEKKAEIAEEKANLKEDAD